MFRVINFVILMRTVAVLTTALTLACTFLVERFLPDLISNLRPMTVASAIALGVTFLLTSKWVSRRLWGVARLFNGSLYPDLNGLWEGEIILADGQKTLQARAVIRQFLLSTEIDMHTETAKSFTLEATPNMQSGQFKLYYTYSAKPKEPGYGTYTGSTIFDIRSVPGKRPVLELSGYYFTDRGTCGRTRLQQISTDTRKDASFY